MDTTASNRLSINKIAVWFVVISSAIIVIASINALLFIRGMGDITWRDLWQAAAISSVTMTTGWLALRNIMEGTLSKQSVVIPAIPIIIVVLVWVNAGAVALSGIDVSRVVAMETDSSQTINMGVVTIENAIKSGHNKDIRDRSRILAAMTFQKTGLRTAYVNKLGKIVYFKPTIGKRYGSNPLVILEKETQKRELITLSNAFIISITTIIGMLISVMQSIIVRSKPEGREVIEHGN